MEKKRAMIAASVAGLLAAVSVIGATTAQAEDKVPCYGINKCKGEGACGSKDGNACAGKNACKTKGFLKLSKDDCLKINGGSLTPAAS